MPRTKDDVVDLILIILVLGFCFSFRDWGLDTFNAALGLRNFFVVLILTALSVGVHELSHEFIGQKYGAKLITKTWKPILLLALVSTFLTNGWIVFAAVWSIILISPLQRTGRKWSHIGPYERAKIAVTGPMMNVALLLLAGLWYSVSPSFIPQKLMFINATLAVFNLFPFFRFVPLLFVKKYSPARSRTIHRTLMNLQKHSGDLGEVPFMEGELVFFGSRPLWAFVFPFTLFLSFVLLTSKEVLASFVSGLVFGIIMYFLWMFFMEPWSK